MEIYIFDAIGDGGVEVEPLVRDLRANPGEQVNLRINSPEGDVFAASALAAALQEHQGAVTAFIDGLAASAASWLAMTGGRIVAGEAAFLLIHNPWTVAAGDADQLRADADMLDKVADSMSTAYGNRLGSREAAREVMRAETWYSAEEALDAGLVDEIAGREPVQAAFDIASRYKNAPAKVLELYGKSQGKTKDKRAMERALRDAGLSQREAKIAASASWRELNHRDDDAAELAGLVNHIQQKTLEITGDFNASFRH